jgi:hypothetical protein
MTMTARGEPNRYAHAVSDGRWTVDDYRTPAGGRPVRQFLDALSKTAKPRVYAVLAMLEEHGNRLLMPHSRPLGDGQGRTD